MYILVDMAVDLIMSKYTVTPVTYDGIMRVENYPYPKDAVREAILNAVINSEYASGYPIRINVYDEKMEIHNAGGLPFGHTLEEIIDKHLSFPRNRAMAGVFRTAYYVETFGRGFEKMRRSYDRTDVKPPVFYGHSHDFVTVFTNIVHAKNIVPKDMNGKSIEDYNDLQQQFRFNEIQRTILRKLASADALGLSDIEDENLNRETARRHLRPLIDVGYAIMTDKDHPSSKNQRYRITSAGRDRIREHI